MEKGKGVRAASLQVDYRKLINLQIAAIMVAISTPSFPQVHFH
jgi:hypothetical protein